MYIFGKWQEFDNLSDKIDEISLMGDDLRSDFINTSIFDIIEILDLMANEWTQDSEFYKKALYLLSKELTFSEDMIIASLDIIPELLSRKSLEERLKLELGQNQRIDEPFNIKSGARVQYMPLGKILHITAGNVFLGFLDSLIMGFLTKNISFVKLSSKNQSFPRLFVESLNKVDKNNILSNKFTLLAWQGGNRLIEVPFVKNIDAIMAWGGEEMINSYREIIPYGVKLFDFGPKISFGILNKDYLEEIGLEKVCDQITKDVCMWDQAACANMQNLFVESSIDLNKLIKSLEVSFSNFNIEIGTVSNDERVEIHKEKSLSLFDEMETGIESNFNNDFNLRFENNLNLRSSPLNRTLIIKKYENINSLSQMLKKFKFYLQTCGLGIESSEEPFISKLSQSGVKRFTKLGNMLIGVNGAPHDGKHVLKELVNIISIEFEQNLKSFYDSTLKNVKFYNEINKNIPLISGETLKEYPINKVDMFLNKQSASNVIFTSGGTTGEPKYSKYSNSEFTYIAELLGQSYIDLGLEESDVVANLFVAGNMWSSFMAIYKALESTPVTQLPIGGLCEIKEIYKYLIDFKVNTLFGIPSLLVDLANYCKSHEVIIEIDKIFYAGEKITDMQLNLFKSVWNVKSVHSAGYASVDVGPIGYQTHDCSLNEHYLFDGLNLEVIDGEAIVSSTIRKSMPVIRYKTGDKIEIIPHSDKVKFRLVGRIDDMVYIWGSRISLSVIKDALYSSGLDNELPFQICLSTSKNAVDNLKIITDKLISKDTFVKELFILSEDIRNTLTLEHVLANLTVQANDKFLKTKKTGKTPQILDLR